jgi:hypothetical protein
MRVSPKRPLGLRVMRTSPAANSPRPDLGLTGYRGNSPAYLDLMQPLPSKLVPESTAFECHNKAIIGAMKGEKGQPVGPFARGNPSEYSSSSGDLPEKSNKSPGPTVSDTKLDQQFGFIANEMEVGHAQYQVCARFT